MASLAYSFCISSLFVVILLNPICCQSQPDYYFFIFGDGLYDPGNTKYINHDVILKYLPSYHHPYGTTFFNESTGRYSDGRIIADFIADKANLSFIPAALDNTAEFNASEFTHGANFALEGATALGDDTNSLTYQVKVFQALVKTWNDTLSEDEATRRLNKAVYLISIGGQDYLNFRISQRSGTLVNQVVSQIIETIKDLYKLGARKFVVQNVLPLGCLPFTKQKFKKDGECDDILNVYAQAHKDELVIKLEKIKNAATEYPGFNYTVFNNYEAMDILISAHDTYGFVSEDVACCGNSTYRGQACGSIEYKHCLCGNKTESLFFDGTHNTDAANKLLAKWMWDDVFGLVKPYGVSDFFRLDLTTQDPMFFIQGGAFKESLVITQNTKSPK